MRQIIRILQVRCNRCLGSGFDGWQDGARLPCTTCGGTGEVDKRVVEVLHDEVDLDVEVLQRNAGAHT